MSRSLAFLVLFAVGSAVVAGSVRAAATPAATEAATTSQRAAIDRLVADYVGLYAGPTLGRWKTLFHPALCVASPQDDGSIKVRSLEEFYERQRSYFATGRKIGERLENVMINEGRRIARVTADFVFIDEGVESRGRLGLHLAQGNDGWKVVAILFSYDEAGS